MARPTKKALQEEAAAKEQMTLSNQQAQEDRRKTEIMASWTDPKFVSAASYDSVPARSKTSNLIKNAFPFGCLRNFRSPFNSGLYGWDVEDAIRVCEGAYWNFPLLKNVIDVMAELSNSVIYLKNGNSKSRTFTAAWMKTVGMSKFTEAWFREYFRSGTCISYKSIADHSPDALRSMTQMYGAVNASIPVHYTLLNPINVRVQANFNFDNPIYARILDKWEVNKVLNPVTDADKKFTASFTPEQIAQMKRGIIPAIPLDPALLSAVFYKKQPYEPMAVPMAYPLLSDINDKMEMKRKDAEFVKKMDNALLHVKVGKPLDQYNTVSNAKTTQIKLQEFFARESVARVLVSSYDVDINWQIPDVNKVLGTAKYEQIDQDLAVGLNAILFNSDEKFTNTSVKVQVFIERLKEARKAFLTFFQEEVKDVCASIGAQSYPDVYFEEISLKDELQYMRIYTHLAQLGILTPAELFDAMDTGKLPSPDESVENQDVYYDQKKSGYYFPLVGGNNQIGMPDGTQYIPPVSTPAVGTTKSGKTSPGRPTGTKGVPKVAVASTQYSEKKLIFYTEKANRVSALICLALRKKFGIKKLSKAQRILAEELFTALAANELVELWEKKINDYIENPPEIKQEFAKAIQAIAIEHELSFYDANILRLAAI